MTTACMGGFCRKRQTCQRYRPGHHDPVTVERLCEKGEDDAYEPIRWVSQAEWTKPKTETEPA